MPFIHISFNHLKCHFCRSKGAEHQQFHMNLIHSKREKYYSWSAWLECRAKVSKWLDIFQERVEVFKHRSPSFFTFAHLENMTTLSLKLSSLTRACFASLVRRGTVCPERQPHQSWKNSVWKVWGALPRMQSAEGRVTGKTYFTASE